MILSGVRLGRGCAVAARAVVTHRVAPYTIVGGSPARPLRERFDDHWRSRVATVDWCTWPRNVLHRYVAELSGAPSERFLQAADAVAAVRDGTEDGRSFHSADGLDETYEVTRSADFTWGRTTVVVACYRHQDYVAAALASVLAQTDQDMTIVVTDDASPDGTADRARDVLQEQRGVPWLIARSRANRGVNRILNDVLATSDSSYLAFLGGDDLWEPEKLRAQHDELARHPGASAVVGDAFRLGSSPATEFERFRIPADRTELTFEDLLFDYPVAACVPLFVTSHIRLAGGWDTSLSYEDQDLLLKLADVAPLPVIHRPLASHRFHPQTSSNVHATAHIESQNRLLLSWWGRTRLGDGRIVDALTFNVWRLYRSGRFDEAVSASDHVLEKSPSREVAIVRELAARRIGRFSWRGRVVLRAVDWQKGPAPLNPRTWAEVGA